MFEYSFISLWVNETLNTTMNPFIVRAIANCDFCFHLQDYTVRTYRVRAARAVFKKHPQHQGLAVIILLLFSLPDDDPVVVDERI